MARKLTRTELLQEYEGQEGDQEFWYSHIISLYTLTAGSQGLATVQKMCKHCTFLGYSSLSLGQYA